MAVDGEATGQRVSGVVVLCLAIALGGCGTHGDASPAAEPPPTPRTSLSPTDGADDAVLAVRAGDTVPTTSPAAPSTKPTDPGDGRPSDETTGAPDDGIDAPGVSPADVKLDPVPTPNESPESDPPTSKLTSPGSDGDDSDRGGSDREPVRIEVRIGDPPTSGDLSGEPPIDPALAKDISDDFWRHDQAYWAMRAEPAAHHDLGAVAVSPRLDELVLDRDQRASEGRVTRWHNESVQTTSVLAIGLEASDDELAEDTAVVEICRVDDSIEFWPATNETYDPGPRSRVITFRLVRGTVDDSTRWKVTTAELIDEFEGSDGCEA